MCFAVEEVSKWNNHLATLMIISLKPDMDERQCQRSHISIGVNVGLATH